MQRIFGSGFKAAATAALMLAASIASAAQPASQAVPAAPSLNVALTYNATLSNLVTSSRFWMQGAGAQIEGRFYGGWGAVADISGMHIANMNSTGAGLDMVTATFGPRYTWSPAHARYQIFGQALAGVANGFNSVFPGPLTAETTANSLAVKAGGGINLQLKPRYALRLFEADYLRTQMPNSTNNGQNNFQLGAGVVMRLR